jgi:hypothetical protein
MGGWCEPSGETTAVSIDERRKPGDTPKWVGEISRWSLLKIKFRQAEALPERADAGSFGGVYFFQNCTLLQVTVAGPWPLDVAYAPHLS